MERPVEAVNAAKWTRAILELKRNNKEITEESVKAVYLRLAGLWLGEPETVQGVTPNTEPQALERVEKLEETRIGKPIRRGKK